MAISVELNTRVRLTTTFTTVQGNALTDPTTVSLFVKDPSSTVTTYTLAAAQVIRDSIGVYHYDILIDVVGNWKYKWQGASALEATSADGTVSGNSTEFVAQL